MRLHFKAKLTFFSRKCQTFLTNYLMSDIILISDVTKLLTQIINAIDVKVYNLIQIFSRIVLQFFATASIEDGPLLYGNLA